MFWRKKKILWQSNYSTLTVIMPAALAWCWDLWETIQSVFPISKLCCSSTKPMQKSSDVKSQQPIGESHSWVRADRLYWTFEFYWVSQSHAKTSWGKRLWHPWGQKVCAIFEARRWSRTTNFLRKRSVLTTSQVGIITFSVKTWCRL